METATLETLQPSTYVFGYADPNAPGNSFKLGRDPITSNVTFHR